MSEAFKFLFSSQSKRKRKFYLWFCFPPKRGRKLTGKRILPCSMQEKQEKKLKRNLRCRKKKGEKIRKEQQHKTSKIICINSPWK